ncbi:MAG: hypothetical protein E7645_07155 [Ruminococcaceae bacterium]|nr:hypothetical protein [Oscillospiraceae bacterium]
MNISQSIPSNTAGGRGQLVFRVATAGGAIPLEGARVIVRSQGAEGDVNRGNALSVMYSDRNGRTPVMTLPTVPRSQSQSPQSPGVAPPFLCYDAEVFLAGYRGIEFVCIPIFDGVTSVQPADMIPLPENGREDGFDYEKVTVVEGENPNL